MFWIYLPLCFCKREVLFSTVRKTMSLFSYVLVAFQIQEFPCYFTLPALTSGSAANYIRPCCIHHPLGSSFSDTVNTLSSSHTCSWPRSAFSPQLRRRHQADLTVSLGAAGSYQRAQRFKPESQSMKCIIKCFLWRCIFTNSFTIQ